MSEPRRKYHSIPLRTQAQTQERVTDAQVATPRPMRLAQPAPVQQNLVSRQDMPAVPDDDRRQAYAPKSAWLWDKDGNPVLRQDKKEMVFHKEKPPRRVHWLFLVGLGMIVTVLLWIGAQWTIASVQAHNVDAQYGMPRTYQVDAVVGHGDSPLHPSHFTFENLRGHIIIIELPGGDIAHAHIYGGPTSMGPDADQVPVTGSFEDVNGDGRPDMIVSIGTGTGDAQTITYLNNGSLFVPQQ